MGFAFLLLSSTEGWSADFKKGLNAYDKKDYTTVLREWITLAEQGNISAQYYLDVMYRKGTGVPQNYKIALKWFRLAAKQEDAASQSTLGAVLLTSKYFVIPSLAVRVHLPIFGTAFLC